MDHLSSCGPLVHFELEFMASPRRFSEELAALAAEHQFIALAARRVKRA